MQYVKKDNVPPIDWDSWFKKGAGERSFDYNSDASALRNLPLAKAFLLNEQGGLCAYCQQKLTEDQASIEHVIPKEFNIELSTNYYNLVAVCKNTPNDPLDNKLHCDKCKQSEMIGALIFSSASDVLTTQNHKYFEAGSDGSLCPKGKASAEDKKLAEVFINILNLNHSFLRSKRAVDHLNPLIDTALKLDKMDSRKFWQRQFENISRDKNKPFRMFLLIYIGKRLGIN